VNDIVRDLNPSKKQTELSGSRLKGWNLLRQDTKACFYLGRHKEFKDFSPWKTVSYFAMMFVPLWKFLALNITQISGACLLIRQK
jgi:hypothetical protein